MERAIAVRKAWTHNLRGVDVDLPRGSLVVITGISGSGKSSLAFDTVHAEGRRRFLETLSPASRAYVERMTPPLVEAIEGLPPTVAVDQRPGPANPRATVASLTEIHDYLRLLYARLGTPHCPSCGVPVLRSTPDQVVQAALSLGEGRKVLVLAPLVRGRKGKHADAFDAVRRERLLRVRVDGTVHDLEEAPSLSPSKVHDIEAVVDRLVIREGVRQRLVESVDLALRLGEGTILLSDQGDDGRWHDTVLGTKLACPACGLALAEVEPRSFSPNSPYGACPACAGLGRNEDGTPCPECGGQKLGPVGRSVLLRGMSLPALLALPVGRAREFLASLGFDVASEPVARPILEGILPRLGFLERVGLDYLAPERAVETLSGGELQRARLASALGSGLVGACFVLDEPTSGLHPRDTDRLIGTLRDLRDAGNSVLVVEHDEAVIRAADWVVDLGPGAGPHGGEIVAEGEPAALAGREPGRSETARRLRGELGPSPGPREAPAGPRIRLVGATGRNLKGVDVEIPLGTLTCVTGVSGSGKSTLVFDVLVPAVRRFLSGEDPAAGGGLAGVEGLEGIDALIPVDQSPIGENLRATPATTTGIWAEVRRVFARTKLARARGYSASRFSFNAKGGRCEVCRGLGERRYRLAGFPDAWVPCESCKGTRYDPSTLEVTFKGRSVADVLAMTVDEALAVFSEIPGVRAGLGAMDRAGLGYLTLGQPADTLSGGEAQRVKLASELARPGTGRTLYVFDEPTTGLHFSDVARLLALLRALTERGNTVVVIEHHLDVIRAADWLIDLGPEGGEGGGSLVAMGTVAQVVAVPESRTGRFLAPPA
jgi:excinuclease ABC subunit A